MSTMLCASHQTCKLIAQSVYTAPGFTLPRLWWVNYLLILGTHFSTCLLKAVGIMHISASSCCASVLWCRSYASGLSVSVVGMPDQFRGGSAVHVATEVLSQVVVLFAVKAHPGEGKPTSACVWFGAELHELTLMKLLETSSKQMKIVGLSSECPLAQLRFVMLKC